MQIKKQEAFYRHSDYYKQILEEGVNLYKQGERAASGLTLLLDNWENIKSGQEWASKNFDKHNQTAVLCMEYALTGMPFLIARLHP